MKTSYLLLLRGSAVPGSNKGGRYRQPLRPVNLVLAPHLTPVARMEALLGTKILKKGQCAVQLRLRAPVPF